MFKVVSISSKEKSTFESFIELLPDASFIIEIEVDGKIITTNRQIYNCKCTSSSHISFNPLQHLAKNKDYVSPELYYMESKWASLMSYGLTADLLKECFPINEKINAEIIRQHAKKISERIEAELGEEHYIYALSLPILMDFKAYHNESATVGIDCFYF